MEAIELTPKQGLKLLKEGNSLTAHLADMSTLRIDDEGDIMWMGKSDTGPTYLDEESVESLFDTYEWHINLI